MDYKKAYALLVAAMSDAIDEIRKSRIISWEMGKAIKILEKGLEQTEEMYISSAE